MYNYDSNGDVAGITNGFSTTDYFLFIGSHGGGVLSAQLRNGSPVTTASGATGGMAGILQVGKGYAAPGTAYFNGDIAEILIYNRLLTGAEIADVGNYLSTAWLRGPEKGTVIGFL